MEPQRRAQRAASRLAREPRSFFALPHHSGILSYLILTPPTTRRAPRQTETERPNVLNESTVPRTYAKSNIEMVETQGSVAFFSLDITQYPLRMYSLTLVGMIVRFGSVFSFLTS